MASEIPKSPVIVSREGWNALPPTESKALAVPVPFVVIHHSHTPKYSNIEAECEKGMRGMQKFHQEVREWADIGYNFAIGGDGRVYEGRGWTIHGAHAFHYNPKSLGICFMGDYTTEKPTDLMLRTGQQLIAYGVAIGMIKPDYKLVGHRQVRNTECPGQAFFDIIQTWPHWDPLIDIQ